MFEEFSKPSLAAWHAQLEKELKGASLDSKDWVLADGTRSKAFHFPKQQPTAAPLVRPSADWQITEDIKVTSTAKAANTAALTALEGGAEALVFDMDTSLSTGDFEQLFQGIFLNYIGLFFRGSAIQQNPNTVLHGFHAACTQRNIAKTALQGGLGYQIERTGSLTDFRFAAELLEYGKSTFPQFRLFELSAEEKDWKDRPSEELISLFQKTHRIFEGLRKEGAAASDIAQSLVLQINIGTSYFVEIAKLRALRLVWLHIQEAWGVPRRAPQVFVRFDSTSFSEAIYTNMIRATTVAMSAVIGGANAVVVLPHDIGNEATNPYGADFSKRIARNVQHLLKSESYMNRVVDPAAGSYYIEDLTNQIAEKVWRKLQNQAVA